MASHDRTGRGQERERRGEGVCGQARFSFPLLFRPRKRKVDFKKALATTARLYLGLIQSGDFCTLAGKRTDICLLLPQERKKICKEKEGEERKTEGQNLFPPPSPPLGARKRPPPSPAAIFRGGKGRRRTTLPELKFWSLRSTSSPTLFFEDEPRLGGSPSPPFPPLQPHLPFDGGEMKRPASLLVRDAGVSTKLTTSVAEEKCETDT